MTSLLHKLVDDERSAYTSIHNTIEESSPDQINELGLFKQTLLHRLANDTSIIRNKELFDPEVMAKDAERYQGLIKGLVTNGSDVNLKDGDGKTPLVYLMMHYLDRKGINNFRTVLRSDLISFDTLDDCLKVFYSLRPKSVSDDEAKKRLLSMGRELIYRYESLFFDLENEFAKRKESKNAEKLKMDNFQKNEKKDGKLSKLKRSIRKDGKRVGRRRKSP